MIVDMIQVLTKRLKYSLNKFKHLQVEYDEMQMNFERVSLNY